MTASQNPSSIAQTITRLRQLTQLDVISDWQVCEQDCLVTALSAQPFVKLQPNEKNYLVWEKGRKVRWFYQEFVIPDQLQGYPLAGLTLRLALTWWAELAEVFVNGEKVQEGDLFDHSCRVVLSYCAQPGETITVAIRLVSPGHDIGGLMRSQLLYESTYDTIDPGFVADELAVIQSYVATFAPNEKLAVEIDWSVVEDRSQFDRSLQNLRDRLIEWSQRIKQHTISLLGHAHLDMAWLWDVDETWRAAERTFRSVLNLQQEFPDLTFCHTTPALYEWIEQNRPEIFAEIQERVKEGRWEIVGGMWVEPEMNLISGEAIARHLLYGQRYWQAKFGSLSRVEWLPDTFGFNWQLPQFLKQAGIEYFVTQKLRWNDTNKYPYEIFNWQAPNRSQVFSLMSSPIGEGIDPIKMTDYAWEWMTRTQTKHCLWLFGVGDHGGGPTRDMLKLQERWAKSPFFPTMKFTSALKYLESFKDLSEIPTWNDELYLEFHRGCYTTHGDQKKFNQVGQTALYEAELWASLAAVALDEPYPKADLETAWKKVLFNQFHDILPGSSITKVFVDANQEWKAAEQICVKIRDKAMAAIAQAIDLPSPPHPDAQAIVVFNSSNWKRSNTVTVQTVSRECKIYDAEGNEILLELATAGDHATDQPCWFLTFLANDIPPTGYRVFWLSPEVPCSAPPTDHSPWELENKFLHITIDAETGNLSSLFDKINQREVLKGAGNQLQAFPDAGQYWDAWNIDPAYAEQTPLATEFVKIATCDRGEGFPNREICVVRKIGNSTFKQTYLLERDSPVLKIKNEIDWQERHVLVKAVFPLNVEADFVTYEIPAGAIQRTTKLESNQEKAMWEVAALNWADLSDGTYGVSLLSECKHGYDAQSNQLRLTLLRGSKFPDPEADLGHHTFTYALYPHAGSWQSAQTVHKAAELKQPLQVLKLDSIPATGTLPPVASLLDLQSDNLMLSCLKQSEDDSEAWILRCYECQGKAAELKLKSDLGVAIADSVDLLERPDGGTTARCFADTVRVAPWQVRTFILRKS